MKSEEDNTATDTGMEEVILECPMGGACTSGPMGHIWKTQKINVSVAIQLLEQHVRCVHQAVGAGTTDVTLKPEKLIRPALKVRDGAIEEESWEFFTHQWATYKIQANLTASAKSHLESCLGDEVTLVLFGRLGQDGWNKLDEEGLLKEVKEMFVKKRNRMVNRLKLQNMIQGDDQPVQQFIASLKQVARTCKYSITCSNVACNTTVDYSQEMVLDQLVKGLNDSESCREGDFKLDTVEKVIMAEESSKATQKESGTTTPGYVAPLSTFRKNKTQQNKSQPKCTNCGADGHNFRDLKAEERHKCRAFGKNCNKCKKSNHFAQVCRSRIVKEEGENLNVVERESMSILQSLRSHSSTQNRCNIMEVVRPKRGRQYMGHLKFDKSSQKFIPHNPGKDSYLEIDIKMDSDGLWDLCKRKLKQKTVSTKGHKAVADTGAAICCAPIKEIKDLGLKQSDIM